MKTKTLVLVLLVTMLMIQDVESWRIRIRGRRIWRRIWRPICRWTCPRVCRYIIRGGVGRIVCSFGCRYLCGKKKREAIEAGHVTPLPRNFDFYDIDDNDLVDIKEFSSTFGQEFDEEGLAQAFKLSDIDGDGFLSIDELFGSECLVFEQDDDAEDAPEPTTTPVPTTPKVK